jgi:hypothetical protein
VNANAGMFRFLRHLHFNLKPGVPLSVGSLQELLYLVVTPPIGHGDAAIGNAAATGPEVATYAPEAPNEATNAAEAKTSASNLIKNEGMFRC